MRVDRQTLDEWLPTLVRYLGVLLTVVLIIATVLGHNDYPSAYIAAAGMVLYKTVADSARRTDNDEHGDHQDRWSGLP